MTCAASSASPGPTGRTLASHYSRPLITSTHPALTSGASTTLSVPARRSLGTCTDSLRTVTETTSSTVWITRPSIVSAATVVAALRSSPTTTSSTTVSSPTSARPNQSFQLFKIHSLF